jgi:hypothetical protein
MAFVNRLAILSPGYGSAISNDSQNLKQNVALTTAGQQTNTFPTSGGLAPAPRSGQIRIKIYNGGGANTTAAIIAQFTDGTNTVIVFSQPAVAIPNTALGGCDFVIDFLVDIVPTSMSILTTLAGTTTTATMDAEIAYEN